MDATRIIELASYTLPSLITGVVAYQFFNLHTKDEAGRRRFLLHREAQKTALPIRIAPISTIKTDYEQLIIAHIEQEFEHNLTQQVYMSDECWSIILTAKNATIQMIRMAAQKETVENANQMRELILNDLLEKQSPSNAALAFIKQEVSDLW